MSTAKSRRVARTSQVPLLVFVGKQEARVDSRLIAKSIGVKHRSLMRLIYKFQVRLEDPERGQLCFEIAVGEREQGGGNPEKYALLNESQAIFLFTLSKNTDQVVEFKDRLTKEFNRLRRRAERQANQRASLEWKQARAAAALTYRLMSNVLKDYRESHGKETSGHHYINEAKLVNWALTGEFCAVDRQQLGEHELALLEKLEYKNTQLLMRGIDRGGRKVILQDLAMEFRMPLLIAEPISAYRITH